MDALSRSSKTTLTPQAEEGHKPHTLTPDSKGVVAGSPVTVATRASTPEKGSAPSPVNFFNTPASENSLQGVGGKFSFPSLAKQQHASANQASLQATDLENKALETPFEDVKKLFATAASMHREAADCYTKSANPSDADQGVNFHNAAESFVEAGNAYSAAASTMEDDILPPSDREPLSKAYQKYGDALNQLSEAHAAGNEEKVQEINNKLAALMDEIGKLEAR